MLLFRAIRGFYGFIVHLFIIIWMETFTVFYIIVYYVHESYNK